MRHIITYILIFCNLALYAQHTSDLGRFEVDFIKGCAPLDITINNLLGANCPCDVRFGDGNQGQNTFTHTYTSPGIYQLEIDYQSTTPRTDFITIEVVDNTLPDFDILTCSANRATVQIIDSNYDQYAIDFDNDGIFENTINQGNPIPPHTYPASGNYSIGVKGINLIAADNCDTNVQPVLALNTLPTSDITSVVLVDENTIDISFTPQQNIVNRLEIATNNSSSFQLLSTLDNATTSISISNASLDTESNYYCFRIGSFDACSNVSTYSPVVCTVNLDLDIQDGRNVVDWNDMPGISNYTVCTNGNCNLSTVTSLYTDINAICNTEYCYQVIANYPSGATSTSFERCGTAFSTTQPDPIIDLIIEADQGQINLEWQDPVNFTAEEYRILRTFGGESELVTGLSTSPYFERVEENTGPYCYSLYYTDICDNSSPIPAPVCSMFLIGTQQGDNSIQLTWNAFTGYSQGVMNYRVEKYDEAGFLINSYTTTNTEFLDDNDISIFQISRYKVFAIPNDASLPESYSNQVRVVKQSKITSPKAFTPNGDGLNDEFLFYATYVKTFNMKIYNRWGELIFVSNRIDVGWDGTYEGKPMPSGAYTYSVRMTDLADRTWNLSGFFALVRN